MSESESSSEKMSHAKAAFIGWMITKFMEQKEVSVSTDNLIDSCGATYDCLCLEGEDLSLDGAILRLNLLKNSLDEVYLEENNLRHVKDFEHRNEWLKEYLKRIAES